MKQLVWNVIYHNVNHKRIETFNVFQHGKFVEDLEKESKRCGTKEEFADILRRNLRYYFGSKTEWEVIISPWCGGQGHEDIKIDAYWQIMNNWEIFLDYVWNAKNKRRRKVGGDPESRLQCNYIS